MIQIYLGLKILLYGVTGTFAVMATLSLLLKLLGKTITREKPGIPVEEDRQSLEEVAAVIAAISTMYEEIKPEKIKIKAGTGLPAWVTIEMGDR